MFIVGETGSGKTSLSIEIAKRFNGEIISADSRAVYKAMNIGTAKPTIVEMEEIPHWCIDLVYPNQTFKVHDFKRKALEAIKDINGREKLPIVVGGSGLYVNSVLYDFKFRPNRPTAKSELEKLSLEELRYRANSTFKDLLTKDDLGNKRRLIRMLESGKLSEKPPDDQVLVSNLVVGISTDRLTHEINLEQRANKMIIGGLVNETQELLNDYGSNLESMKGNAYESAKKYILKSINGDELVKSIVQFDKRLSKKQRTWFRRNKNITWVNNQMEAIALVDSYLKKNFSS